MIDPVTIGFGAGVLIAGASAAYAARKGDGGHALLCAGALAVIFAASNIRYALTSDPRSMGFYCLMDAGASFLVLELLRRRPIAWKWALLAFLVASLISHVWFWAASSRTWEALYSYVLIINLLFGAELVCVAYGGGRHAWRFLGDIAGHRLSGGRADPYGALRRARPPKVGGPP